MKFALKGLGILALSTVCCSVASAYAYGEGAGTGYAYLTSSSGPDITFSLYGYYLGVNLNPSFGGLFSDYSSAWTDLTAKNGTYGFSYASPLPVASYDQNLEQSYNTYLVLNTSTTQSEWAVIHSEVWGYAGAYSDGNGFAEGIGMGAFGVSNGDFFVAEDSAASGANVKGWNQYFWDYSYGGSGTSYDFITYYPADSNVWGGAGWYIPAYSVLLAPGQSLLVQTFTESAHAAYSATPAPAALATFGIGILSVLRRRRRA